jgi:hypothetical protein
MGSGEVGIVQGKEEDMGEGEGSSESPIGQDFWRAFSSQPGLGLWGVFFAMTRV